MDDENSDSDMETLRVYFHYQWGGAFAELMKSVSLPTPFYDPTDSKNLHALHLYISFQVSNRILVSNH